MPIKNPTGWSNADTKHPTAFTNADPKFRTSWGNADTKNPVLTTPDSKENTSWHEGTIINPGSLILFANNLRTLVSNDGRSLVSTGYYSVEKTPTPWSQIG